MLDNLFPSHMKYFAIIVRFSCQQYPDKNSIHLVNHILYSDLRTTAEHPSQKTLPSHLNYNIELHIPAWTVILAITQGITYSNNSSLNILFLVDEHVRTHQLVNFVFNHQNLEIVNKFPMNSTEKNYYTNTHAPFHFWNIA